MNPSRWLLGCALLLSLLWGACGDTDPTKGAPCSLNQPCSKGLKCLSGRCGDGQKDSPCGKHTDCIQGLYCVAQSCQTDPPESPPEVPAEEKAALEPPPEITDTSDAGQRESTPGETLGQPCRQAFDCQQGEVCLIQPGGTEARCAAPPLPCQTNQDCQGQSGTTCRLLNTSPGTHGTYCVIPFKGDNTLQAAGGVCQTDRDCLSGICLSGSTCGAFCKDDTDCPSQNYCGTYTFFQKGEYGGCYPKCTSDADCPPGYACSEESRCEPKQPGKVGSACRQQGSCDGGLCLNSWNNGYCLRSCLPNKIVECDGKGQGCPPERCLLDPDQANRQICVPECPETGTVCTLFGEGQAFCVRACVADQDCRADYYCATINQGKAKACLPRGSQPLGTPCETDVQCQGGICHPFPKGQYCTQRCNSNNPCPAGFDCKIQNTDDPNSTLCEETCLKDNDCPTGYKCESQRCVIPDNTTERAIGEACSLNKQCQSGLCLSGTGQPLQGACSKYCSSQIPCPEGSTCTDLGSAGKLCLKSCESNSQCTRSSDFCYLIHPRDTNSQQKIPCDKRTDCPKSDTFSTFCATDLEGRFCTTGVCLPRGSRTGGQPCLSALQCQSGFCYIQPSPKVLACKSSQDCPTSAPICQSDQCTCRNSQDCPAGWSCFDGRCTEGGVCAASCDSGGSCSSEPNASCVTLRNPKLQTIGNYCLQQCRSDLQCLNEFHCQAQGQQKVCALPANKN